MYVKFHFGASNVYYREKGIVEEALIRYNIGIVLINRSINGIDAVVILIANKTLNINIS